MFHLWPQYYYNQCYCYGNGVIGKQVFEEKKIIISMKINGKNPSLYIIKFIYLKMPYHLKSKQNYLKVTILLNQGRFYDTTLCWNVYFDNQIVLTPTHTIISWWISRHWCMKTNKIIFYGAWPIFYTAILRTKICILSSKTVYVCFVCCLEGFSDKFAAKIIYVAILSWSNHKMIELYISIFWFYQI